MSIAELNDTNGAYAQRLVRLRISKKIAHFEGIVAEAIS
jgi:hypothetical protein